MSRSRKKHPIIKDGGVSKRYHKKLSNKKLRARTNHVLSNLDSLDNKLFPTAKIREIVDQYYICDRKDSPLYITSWSYPYVWMDYKGEQQVIEYSKKDIRTYYNK